MLKESLSHVDLLLAWALREEPRLYGVKLCFGPAAHDLFRLASDRESVDLPRGSVPPYKNRAIVLSPLDVSHILKKKRLPLFFGEGL